MSHSAAEIRAALFNRKLNELPVDWVISGLEDFTGELSVIELPAKEARAAEKAAEDADGVMDQTLMMAGVVVKGLIHKETKEPILDANSLESVAGWGLSVLKLISDRISEASGVGPDALAAAKKNYQTILAKGSDTSSPPSSAPTETLTPSSTENGSAI